MFTLVFSHHSSKKLFYQVETIRLPPLVTHCELPKIEWHIYNANSTSKACTTTKGHKEDTSKSLNSGQ